MDAKIQRKASNETIPQGTEISFSLFSQLNQLFLIQ